MLDRGLRCGEQAAVVDGAERVEFSIEFGDDAIGIRFVQKLFQEEFGYIWHIARNNQVPVGLGHFERGIKAADRATIFDGIGHDGQAQVRVFFDGADQRYVARRAADFGGDFFNHGGRAERQQGFVAAHAATGSAHQNKSRGSHEMMLPTPGHTVETNKKVYICFLMAFAMLAASPSRAADAVSAPVVHRTQVVKADPRTGKLVRSVVVSSRPAVGKITISTGESGKDFNAMVDKSAKAHDVDPLLVHSIIKVESNYNAHAVSNKGAQGLMQLTPSTARMLGVNNSFDPQQNIEAGVKYLKYLKDLYKDDRLALAAYNAGPGAVDKYKWIPPYAETQNYVYQVGKRYGEARRAADAAKPVEIPAAEVKAVEVTTPEIKPAAVEQFIDENGRLHLKTAQ
jgi:hypothetical protein